MTTSGSTIALTKRERQIMDLVYLQGQVTAAEVQAGLPDDLTNSTVRTLLSILVRKGALQRRKDGMRYVYRPVRPRAQAGKSAIRNVMDTFFAGSVSHAVAALLDARSGGLPREEYERLQQLIESAKKKDKS